VLCIVHICLTIQEVERMSEKVRIESSNVDDLRQQMQTAESAVRHADEQHRQCDEWTERVKQRLSTAEAKLERLATERHCLLVYAVVVNTRFLQNFQPQNFFKGLAIGLKSLGLGCDDVDLVVVLLVLKLTVFTCSAIASKILFWSALFLLFVCLYF